MDFPLISCKIYVKSWVGDLLPEKTPGVPQLQSRRSILNLATLWEKSEGKSLTKTRSN